MLVLSSGYTFWAQKVPLNPQEGEMVFVQQRVVVDEIKLDSSLKKSVPLLMEMMQGLVARASKKDTLAIDTGIASQLASMLRMSLDPRGTVTSPTIYRFRFKDSVIAATVKHHPLDDNEDVTIINRSDGTYAAYVKKDSVLIQNNLRIIIPRKDSDKEIHIEEYKQVRKKIMGFDCFKILVTTKRDVLQDFKMLSAFGSFEPKQSYLNDDSFLLTREMYVTEEIQCKYHPATNLAQVLENYFPLQIIERENLIMGVETRTLITEIDID